MLYQFGFYIRFLMQSDVMDSNKSRYPIKTGFICHLMSYMPLNTVYHQDRTGYGYKSKLCFVLT